MAKTNFIFIGGRRFLCEPLIVFLCIGLPLLTGQKRRKSRRGRIPPVPLCGRFHPPGNWNASGVLFPERDSNDRIRSLRRHLRAGLRRHRTPPPDPLPLKGEGACIPFGLLKSGIGSEQKIISNPQKSSSLSIKTKCIFDQSKASSRRGSRLEGGWAAKFPLA